MLRFIALTAVIACAIGCEASGDKKGNGDKKGKGAPPPALVEVATTERGSLTDGWRFLGRVEPALSATIAAAVAGHVVSVTAREGDSVKKRQVLVRLDAANAKAAVDAVAARVSGIRAQLEIARKQLARVAKLEYPTVSEAEKERFSLAVTDLESQLAIQEAELRRARVTLSHHVVRAPFAGTVRARHVDPGDWVAVGAPVLDVLAVEQIEIHVDVSAELGGRLEVGGEARLIGEPPASAEIAGVVPALDADTRTMRVRLVVKERPAWLIAGTAVDVEFAVSFESSDGVIVPRDALVRGPAGVRVVVLDTASSTGSPIAVDVIASAADKALVRGPGLAPGVQVITRGNERLRPAQPVKVGKPEIAGPTGKRP